MPVEAMLTVYDKGFDEKVDTYGEHITRWTIPGRRCCPTPTRSAGSASTSSTPADKAVAPVSDGGSGLWVVRVVEGLQQELDASRRSLAAEA
jgi:hypothetical protein